jgi:hypothetical protein
LRDEELFPGKPLYQQVPVPDGQGGNVAARERRREVESHVRDDLDPAVVSRNHA